MRLYASKASSGQLLEGINSIMNSACDRYLHIQNIRIHKPKVQLIMGLYISTRNILDDQGRGAYDTTGVPKPPPRPQPR